MRVFQLFETAHYGLLAGAPKRSAAAVVALGLVWMWPLVAGAQDDDPTITVCNDCVSGAQYSHAAMEAAQFEFDGISMGGSDDVYVVNVTDGQVVAYHVTRTLVDPDPTFLGDETYTTTAEAFAGDPLFMDDLADAMQAIEDFNEAIVQDVPAEELELPPGFNSALDLIGGDLSDAYRRSLRDALVDRFNEFEDELSVRLADLTSIAAGFFNVRSALFNPGTGQFSIVFPDGSWLVARVKAGEDPTDPEDIEFEVQVDVDSIRFVCPVHPMSRSAPPNCSDSNSRPRILR